MFDDFPLPDGDVPGSAAVVGGTWSANPSPVDPLRRVSHLAQSDLNTESLAAMLSAMTSPQFAGDWWCRIVAKFPDTSGGLNVFGCWLGDDQAGPYCGMAIQATGGHSHDFGVTFGNIGAGDAGFSRSDLAFGVDTEWVFQFTAADGGRVSLLRDDVELGFAAPYVLDPLTPLDFAFGGIQNAAGPRVTISEVELGLGVYQ